MKKQLLFFTSALIPSVSVRLDGTSPTAECWKKGCWLFRRGRECVNVLSCMYERDQTIWPLLLGLIDREHLAED